jgi:hypothetical protein
MPSSVYSVNHYGGKGTSSGCCSRTMSPCPPSSRLPMRMTTPHSMIPPGMLGRPASVPPNFAARPECPANIPTSTSSEIRNCITQGEQHSLCTYLSELQAVLQRFCADMEARTQQADNSATSVQAEDQNLGDESAAASNHTVDKEPHTERGPYCTSSGCSSRTMSSCPPSSRLPMRMTTPHSMIPPDMLGRPASVRPNFATRPEHPANIPTSTSSEIRNYITQEEQHSPRTSLPGLQAGFQRFCAELEAEFQLFRAEMEAPTQQADENQQLRDISTKSMPSASTLAVKVTSSRRPTYRSRRPTHRSCRSRRCIFCDSEEHLVSKCPDAQDAFGNNYLQWKGGKLADWQGIEFPTNYGKGGIRELEQYTKQQLSPSNTIETIFETEESA